MTFMPPVLLANIAVDFFHRGGPIMWPIAAVTVFAVCILFERLWWWLQLARSRQPKVLDAVLEALENGDTSKAQGLCASATDPVLRVINAGLNHRHASLQGALQSAAGIELRAAGRYLTAMDTIITLAPLLGLLGTVTGIMGSFQSIGGSEQAVEKVTGGIGEALIATACGLGIAIMTLIPYNWLHAKVAGLQHDIETAACNVEVFVASKN